jgi:hypothetical protein
MSAALSSSFATATSLDLNYFTFSEFEFLLRKTPAALIKWLRFPIIIWSGFNKGFSWSGWKFFRSQTIAFSAALSSSAPSLLIS